MRPRSRPARILGLVLILGLVGAGAFLFKQRAGTPGDALASGDSTAVAGETSGGKNGKDKDDDAPKPVPVETAAAGARDLPATFQATGSLQARRSVELIAKAQGQIVALRREEGDFVKRGQVLLELEHEEEKLLLEKSRVAAGTAEREMKRIQELTERGLGSESTFESQRELAETTLLDRDLARVRLDNRIVRSPFPGQITARHVEMGQTVNPGEPLFSVADVSHLEVTLFLPERVVRDLQVGQPVEVRPDISPDLVLEGRVDRIAPAVDPTTSTVKVVLRVDDHDGPSRVGSFVRVRITTDVRTDVVSVPKKALVPEAGATYVFVAEADTVRKVGVTTGYTDDDFVEITQGIGLGDRVVTVGQGGLRHGSLIRDLSREEVAPGGDSGATGTEGR